MGANTKIEWTHGRILLTALTIAQLEAAFDMGCKADGDELLIPGYTFNPWYGCTKVSEGCEQCYAEGWAKRSGLVQWGPFAPRRRSREHNWNEIRKLNDAAGRAGIRVRVFCASLADWLDDAVPVEWLANLLELIQFTPNLDWLLLTKRPQNWNKRIHEAFQFGWDGDEWASVWLDGYAPANVWIGTTTENQKRLDERIPVLLTIPARVRFLSCEPLLGPLEFSNVTKRSDAVAQLGKKALDGIHWVIVGGESGPKARPMNPAWVRSIRNQCQAADVPMLFKQWGEWHPGTQTEDVAEIVLHAHKRTDGKVVTGPRNPQWHEFADGNLMARVGKEAAGRFFEGIEHNGQPKVGAS
jgi:protein gp37